jgi:Ca-activated chloride channel family protein
MRTKLNLRRVANAILVSAIIMMAFVPSVIGQTAGVVAGTAPKTDDAQVLLSVSVTNRNGIPVKGLEKDHLTVFSGKTAQEINFFSDQDEPASVVFLIDTSGSMQFSGRKSNLAALARSSILDFIATGNEANEYAILGFGVETRQSLNWSQDGGAIVASLSQLAATEAKGPTAFYQACYNAVDLIKRSKHRKRVMIILSDGEDNASKDLKYSSLRRTLLENRTQVFTVTIPVATQYYVDGRGILSYPQIYRRQAADGERLMEKLAADTGGMAFIADDVYGLRSALETTSLLLRNQYLIGFNPSQAADSKQRELKLKLNLPAEKQHAMGGLLVRHPMGY